MSRVYCVKCRKAGLITCACVALATSVAGAPTNGPASTHAVSPISNGGTGTIGVATNAISVIHDEVTETPRIIVLQDWQRERARATASSSPEIARAAEHYTGPPRKV